jgi:hypothetical protein
MTVGYGDMFPRTVGGRIIAITASIGGLLFTATLVTIVNSGTALNSTERLLIDYLKNFRMYEDFKKASATLIAVAWKIRKYSKNYSYWERA